MDAKNTARATDGPRVQDRRHAVFVIPTFFPVRVKRQNKSVEKVAKR